MKNKISKKNLSATFHIFSKCHFLSNGEGVCGQQAISGHPSQPTLNYRKNMKKKKSKKKIQKKKKKKKKKSSYFKVQNEEELFQLFSSSFLPRLSAKFQIFSKCHFPNFQKNSKSGGSLCVRQGSLNLNNNLTNPGITLFYGINLF